MKPQPQPETQNDPSTDNNNDVDNAEASVGASNEHDSDIAESAEGGVAPSVNERTLGVEKDTKKEEGGKFESTQEKSPPQKEKLPSDKAPPAPPVGQNAVGTKTSACMAGGGEMWRTFSITAWAGVSGEWVSG